MEQPPDDKRPARTVPKAAEQENHHQIERGAALSVPVSAHGNVEVVSEEAGECDMPASPELSE